MSLTTTPLPSEADEARRTGESFSYVGAKEAQQLDVEGVAFYRTVVPAGPVPADALHAARMSKDAASEAARAGVAALVADAAFMELKGFRSMYMPVAIAGKPEFGVTMAYMHGAVSAGAQGPAIFYKSEADTDRLLDGVVGSVHTAASRVTAGPMKERYWGRNEHFEVPLAHGIVQRVKLVASTVRAMHPVHFENGINVYSGTVGIIFHHGCVYGNLPLSYTATFGQHVIERLRGMRSDMAPRARAGLVGDWRSVLQYGPGPDSRVAAPASSAPYTAASPSAAVGGAGAGAGSGASDARFHGHAAHAPASPARAKRVSCTHCKKPGHAVDKCWDRDPSLRPASTFSRHHAGQRGGGSAHKAGPQRLRMLRAVLVQVQGANRSWRPLQRRASWLQRRRGCWPKAAAAQSRCSWPQRTWRICALACTTRTGGRESVGLQCRRHCSMRGSWASLVKQICAR